MWIWVAWFCVVRRYIVYHLRHKVKKSAEAGHYLRHVVKKSAEAAYHLRHIVGKWVRVRPVV